MYDSMLYGYGMTLGTLYKIQSTIDIDDRFNHFHFNDFVKTFLESEPHSLIRREFDRLFDEHDRSHVEARNQAIESLRNDINEITTYGFERWVSKYLLDDTRPISHDEKLFSYLLYNFWHSKLEEEFLGRTDIAKVVDEVSCRFKNLLEKESPVFTTNFDLVNDNVLCPEHIHGRFASPFNRAAEVVNRLFDNNKFEYSFLLGTNGFEKLNRLSQIKDISNKPFDDDFFFSSDIKLGHLLIYGLSFGRSEFMTDEFLAQHPEHRTASLLMTVDGHILERLSILMKNGKLMKITLSYFTQQDIENYKLVLEGTDLMSIIEFKKCSEICH